MATDDELDAAARALIGPLNAIADRAEATNYDRRLRLQRRANRLERKLQSLRTEAIAVYKQLNETKATLDALDRQENRNR